MNSFFALAWAAATLALAGTAIPAQADQWVNCIRNTTTGQRGWAMGARYVDLGTSVPFRATGGTLHPKFQLPPDAELGQCLVPSPMLKDLMN